MYDLDYSARCTGGWVKGEVDNFDRCCMLPTVGSRYPFQSCCKPPVGEILRAAFLMYDRKSRSCSNQDDGVLGKLIAQFFGLTGAEWGAVFET